VRSADLVQRAAQGERPVYGVNTGFGKLASRSISRETGRRLATGIWCARTAPASGEPLAPAIVRLMLALKAASLRGATRECASKSSTR